MWCVLAHLGITCTRVGQGQVCSKIADVTTVEACISSSILLESRYFTRMHCFTCFLGFKRTFQQKPSVSGHCPIMPWHLGRFCKHFVATPI